MSATLGDWRGLGWRFWCLALAAGLYVCLPVVALPLSPVLVFAVAVTRRPYRLGLPDYLGIALACWTATSSLWSVDSTMTVRASLYLANYIAVFVGIRSSVRAGGGTRDLLALAGGYLAGATVLVLRMLVAFTLDPASRPNLPDVNANYAAYSLATAFAVQFLMSRLVRVPREIVVPCSVAFLAGIAVSGSRGALVSVVLFLAWCAAASLLKRPPVIALVATLTLGAVISASDLVSYVAGPVESNLGRGTGTWSGRLDLWPLAQEVWRDNFLFGSGAHTFAAHNERGLSAHNLVLELGSGTGILGLALFLAVMATALWGAERALLAGALLAASVVSYLTGTWDISGPAWTALALVSVTPRTPLEQSATVISRPRQGEVPASEETDSAEEDSTAP